MTTTGEHSSPSRRGVAVVLTSTGIFALAALALTWVTTAVRSTQISEWVLGQQAVTAARDARAVAAGITVGEPVDWSSYTRGPAEQVGAILEHVATLSLVFAAVAAVVVVLIAFRAYVFALLAAVSATASVALGAGALTLLTGTIEQPEQAAAANYVPTGIEFGAPLWWRLVVAAGVALLLAATIVAAHRLVPAARVSREREPVGTVDPQRGSTLAARLDALAVPGLALVFLVAVAVLGASTITYESHSGGSSGLAPVALLLTYVGLGTAAVAAGACLRGRDGAAAALAISVLVLAAAVTTWSTHWIDGGAPQAFGWVVDLGSSEVPLYGTLFLAAALVAAVPFGWVGGTLLHRLADSGPVRTRNVALETGTGAAAAG